MKIYKYSPGDAIPEKRVIALGFFDGVHRGHRAILEAAVKESERLSLPSAVFTFFSESDGLKGAKRIYGTDEKIRLAEKCGIDEIILADFNAVRNISAADFAEKILISELGCATALCGTDFRFGKGALGDVSLLRSILNEGGAALITPAAVCDGGDKISSSFIKKLLGEGKVKRAAELLGEPYSVLGEIRHGLGLGKKFGFPTVNTEISESEPDLPSGVYKCSVEIDGKDYGALTNVGTCPTVGKREKHRETYIIGYCSDAYGMKVRISFLDFIREEKKFDSAEELTNQINEDIKKAFGSED